MKESIKLKIKQILLNQGIQKPNLNDEKIGMSTDITQIPAALLKAEKKVKNQFKTSKTEKS